MLIKQKIGNLTTIDLQGRVIDRLPLEWHECNKRILHKRTASGRDVVLKFLGEGQSLQEDDVLYADENSVIAVEILPCEAIVLKPVNMYQMAYACYEIGNKHLPLFFEDDALLSPYDAPVYRQLVATGFEPQLQRRKLLYPLRTTVSVHSHAEMKSESLFSKILKLTTATTNE